MSTCDPNRSKVDDARPLIAGFFRHEAGRLVASLGRLLGPGNVDLAEDVVQDTLAAALQAWRFGGLPDNPSAWLNRTARNRAIDVMRRHASHRRYAAEYAASLASGWTAGAAVNAALELRAADENQLRLMLSLCNPALGPTNHVALILKYLCGFSSGELAAAFLTAESTVNKRLTRGKAQLRKLGSLTPPAELTADPATLPSILQALYLMFNEGYHGNNPSSPVRETLCEEAIRLADLLIRAAPSRLPAAHALAALMKFSYARIAGRLDDTGVLVPLSDQDRTLWNRQAIAEGLQHLSLAAEGETLTSYHLEAGIACQHCLAPSLADTDWPAILNMYQQLEVLAPGPLVSLNIALVHAMLGNGKVAQSYLTPLFQEQSLAKGPFLWAAKGEIHRRTNELAAAQQAFREAAIRARNPAEASGFERRAEAAFPAL